MTSENEINIKGLYSLYPNILGILLRDNTTKKNIIWATDHYQNKGLGYSITDEIKPCHLNGKVRAVRPRIEKSKAEQTKRSKDNAEVFTPSWIVNKQNNLADNVWFGRENRFNTENPDNSWNSTEKVVFDGEKTWADYVCDIRLEVCCGEAPYLVSRYDTVSGEAIENKNRIGLLDRKFRVIHENVTSDEEWLDYAIKAIKSVYGYEFQGDNLLIARENVLLDFVDYYFERFGKLPGENLLIEVATIISWNLWQMDGLKYVVPFSCHNEVEKVVQLSLFDEPEEPKLDICPGCKANDPKKHNGKRCYIMDWEKKKKIKFVSLMWRNNEYVG